MTQINKIRNEIVELTTDTKEIQRIVRKYYGQLYAKKLDNLDKMDRFLETYNLPKLNQEESENLNLQITTSEIEAVIKNKQSDNNNNNKNLSTNTSPGQNVLTNEFH